MNVRLQQLNITIGDIEGNTQLILSALQKAEQDHIDLLILPELCVCGYLPQDLLERTDFRQAIFEANKKIIDACGQTALIFGSVTGNSKRKGRPLFNTALMAQAGEQLAEVHKMLLPTYDVFDEDRYFERAQSNKCVEWQDKKLGITVCEDIWANNSSVQYHTYPDEPVQELVNQGADVIINISASPFTVEKSEERLQMLKGHVERSGLPLFYANQAGANTELISDGDSMVLDSDANIVARAPLFEEAFIDAEWQANGTVESLRPDMITDIPLKEERIFEALRHGLRDYIKKTGVTPKVVLGLSGGIDSALVACIAAEALGAENVMGVGMPSEFSSEGSVTDAELLANNLGIEFHQLPIHSLYEQYMDVLKPLFEGTQFGVAEENLQSRARGVLLMALANKFNRFVLNTGNKSELATGYCTLYGDMNGALAVIGDVYKTEVFALAGWLNELYYQKEIIPRDILNKPPSAELRPNQADTDSLPEYDKLDIILKLYIENQYSVARITDRGFEKELVQKVIQLVDRNEYKRYQAPPGLKIHGKAFGFGRRWPLVHKWESHA